MPPGRRSGPTTTCGSKTSATRDRPNSVTASSAAVGAAASTPAASTPTEKPTSLPLRRRPIDIFFIAIFSVFIITCIISDSVEGLGLDQVANSTNILVQWNYWYASNFDPLYQSHPVWLRF